MALDTELLCRPTDSLILSKPNRFFPFRIPNTLVQTLEASTPSPVIFPSTADPDRIYAAVGRIIYSIHLSSHKREIVAVVPFDPKCLTAGLGWIAVGGTDNGDCAFISLESSSSTPCLSESDSRLLVNGGESTISCPPEVFVHQFGGTIINSITLHRFPSDEENGFTEEDVAVLSNNDKTVGIFSLTLMEMIETIRHPYCMNHAVISPDSKLLAAVGDENQIYFYNCIPCPGGMVRGGYEENVMRQWSWPLLRSVELDSDCPDLDCCFAIAFSPSSHLCAVGSQAGVISVFDVVGVLAPEVNEKSGREDILHVFKSTRSHFDGGAVRSMSFSPHPWDILVWVEEHGRVGVADVRQAFSRQQILQLDLQSPDLEHVHVENIDKAHETEDSGSGSGSGSELGTPAAEESPLSPEYDDGPHRLLELRRNRRRRTPAERESQTIRESLARDLTARDRQINDILNTIRSASSTEGGGQGPQQLPNALVHALSPSPQQSNRSPMTPPPEQPFLRHEPSVERAPDQARVGPPRRRGSIILSQDSSLSHPSARPSSALIPHPAFSVRWTYSPSRLPLPESVQDATVPYTERPTATTNGVLPNGSSSSSSSSSNAPNDTHSHRSTGESSTTTRPSNNSDNGYQRLHRSRSIPRRANRLGGNTAGSQAQVATSRTLQELSRVMERFRSQRQAVLEESHRLPEWQSQYRRLLELDQFRPTPRSRHDRNFNDSSEEDRGVGTAGIGWANDGQTLYIGTTRGILEYHINTDDRKTFPGFSCR
ncbi:hypothetical protein FQN57_005549 [Myotisia sp. PD_48]|nr:hypothetical protein FQN57_005549 [Myotisia sp. PD_48]